MKDTNIPQIWRLNKEPSGASVWPYLVGHLHSYGQSYYHSHPDYFCPHIITKGRGIVKTAVGTSEVKTGDMFTLWPGVEIEYYDEEDDPWEFYYFHIQGEGMQDFVESCGFRKKKICLHPHFPGQVEKIFSGMYKLLESPQENDEFQVLSLLFQLPTSCRPAGEQQKQDRNREILFKAETLINTQLATGINVNELCAKIGISRITLFRIFQKELQETPINYISSKRITKARELLRTSQNPLETIAKLSGFQSEKYFMRKFKQETGMTPSEYRRHRV